MAAPTSIPTWVQAAFLSAKEEFLGSLNKNFTFDFSKIATVDDVYNAASQIQRQQAKTKTFRGLKRIEPLIKVLQEYGDVADTLVQVKPEILSLIWGPLKFLLQAASALTAAFEKIIKILGDVGLILPSFQQYATLFPHNDSIRRVLCLFFEDILNIYAVLLNFITNKRLNVILEPFWPSVRTKIDKIQETIEHHKALMTVNVTLEDISRAQRARKQAMEEYESAQKFRDHQTFSTIRNEIHPETHHKKLADILQRTSEGSGKWLDKEDNFMRWLDPVDRTIRCLWLCGIPGSGKTYLAGNIIQRMQKTGQCILFAFISHECQSVGKTLSILHSLLFQALEEVSSLQLILPDSSDPDHKKLVRDQSFVKDLLCTTLTSIGPTFIVLDGLDEIEEVAWKSLLSTILDIQKNCVETKVLVSSREVREIALALEKHVATIRIDRKNFEDIQAFVYDEGHSLLLEFESCGASKEVRSGIRVALESIAKKSDGMFLYAKLVLHVVKDHRTLSEIQSEVDNLPDGLDQAYGRIISRIEEKMSPKLRTVVRMILMWIVCVRRPLREEELLQILVIDIGGDDFTRGRKDYRDIRQACGPIIEVLDGVVRFVHFTVKEYLLHKQSNNFLNLADAHLNAVLICATYLSYSSLDNLFTNGERADIESQTLNGDFVLLEYAVLEYMEHIKAWIKNKGPQDSTERIYDVLSQLFETRGSGGAFNDPAPSQSFMDQFELFQDDPDLQHSLASAAFFSTGTRMGIIATDETTDFSAKDPLTLFSALAEFRRHLEDTTCDGPGHSPACSCQTLEKLYGPRLYHCNKIFCSAYISGFQTKESRDQHLKMHSLNFKCPESGCFFADEGFRSNIQLSRHMASAHQRSDIPVVSVSDSGLTVLPRSDQFHVLEDAVMNSRLDAVQQLITKYVVTEWYERNQIINLAARYSPPDLLLWLLSYFTSSTTLGRFKEDDIAGSMALSVAIESENLPNIKLLLSRRASMEGVPVYFQLASSFQRVEYGFPAILCSLKRWNVDLMRFLVEECGVTLPAKWTDKHAHPAGIFEARHLSDASLEDVRSRFAAIKPYLIWPEAYKLGTYFAVRSGSPSVVKVCLENGGDPDMSIYSESPLYHNVQRSGSNAVKITELLLEYGANPNIKRGSNSRVTPLSLVACQKVRGMEHMKHLLQHGADPNVGKSSLYLAVRFGIAEMAKLLLQHGADSNVEGNKAITSLAGMKKIEGYFGAPWDDIVRRIQAGEDLEGSQGRKRA